MWSRARFAADLSYLPLMLELQQRYERQAAHQTVVSRESVRELRFTERVLTLINGELGKAVGCRWIKRPAASCCAGTRRWCAIRSNC